MKKVSVDSLKGNEILALPVVSDNDIVLIHADVVLTSDLINPYCNCKCIPVGNPPEITRVNVKTFNCAFSRNPHSMHSQPPFCFM